MATPDSGAEAMDSGAEDAVTQDSGAEEPTAADSAGKMADERIDLVDGGGSQSFPVRLAISASALLDRSPSTAHIRSEQIRRIAQLCEEPALAQEGQAAMQGQGSGRWVVYSKEGSGVSKNVFSQWSEERQQQVRLVPVEAPPPEKSRRVDAILVLGSGGAPAEQRRRVNAILALNSGGAPTVGSDAEGDEEDEEMLWEKVRAKIAARRSKFHRLETYKDEPEAQSQPAKPVRYIEQSEEQKVLRSLGSAVLAIQKLAGKEKARDRLINDKSEAERRLKKTENQRTDAQNRLEKTKGKLTRDSAFERNALDALITRLNGTKREETRKIDKLAGQIADADAVIDELRSRAAA